MFKRPYGLTGKQISLIGMGGMRFAEPDNRKKCVELIHYAHSKGINYFDTAPGYCGDQSELNFGEAFKTMPRDSFYVSTKYGRPDPDGLRETLERSIERLNVDKIDFFHIWCVITLEEWNTMLSSGAVAAAVKAKDEGLIEHLCVSSHLRGEDIKILLDEAPFEGVTIGYCAINFPFRQACVDVATQRKVGVVTMNPLGGGIIPSNPERFDLIRTSPDETIVDAALRFNLSHSGITCVLVGFSEISHVDQAVAAAERFTPLTDEQMQGIKGKILKDFDGLCTGCGYCMPCPAGLQIPKLMDSWNQAKISDNWTITKRLKWHWNMKPKDALGCTECGACEKKCPQQLPIRKRIKDIVKEIEEE